MAASESAQQNQEKTAPYKGHGSAFDPSTCVRRKYGGGREDKIYLVLKELVRHFLSPRDQRTGLPAGNEDSDPIS